MKKLCVVEVHPDDFWLNMSMYCYRQRKDIKLVVVTVFTKGKGVSPCINTEVALKACEFDYKWYALDYTNLEDRTNVQDKTEKQRLRDSVTSLKEEFLTVNKKRPNELEQDVKKIVSDCDEVFVPMGYKNPNHNMISRMWFHPRQKFYREYPYFWNASPLLKNADYNYAKYISPETFTLSAEELAFKWKMFAQIYKDQIGSM